jgi:hypothetical protein
MNAMLVYARLSASDETVASHDFPLSGIPRNQLLVTFFSGIERVQVAGKSCASPGISESDFSQSSDFL